MTLTIKNENDLSSQIKSAFKAQLNAGLDHNGDFKANLTIGLASAGGSLLLVITFFISWFCHRHGCCRRAGHRRPIYNDQLRDEETGNEHLMNAFDGVAIEMSKISTISASVQQVPSNNSNQTQTAESSAETAQTYRNQLKTLNEQEKQSKAEILATAKKIKDTTASLRKLQLNHPTSSLIHSKRKPITTK